MTDENGVSMKAKGGYTYAVPCGLLISCKDHSLLNIKLDNKIFKDTIMICDWYGADVPMEE